jgi:broad specificity phosphatase PhoE
MNDKTTIVIARHGTTEWNEKGLMQGVKDSPLTIEGIKIAHKLKDKLKDYKFDLIFSSDLLRAKRTADIVALEHKLDVETTELLRERSFGRYEGKPYSVYNEEVHQLFKELESSKKMTYKPEPDIESQEEVAQRFLRFVREIALLTPGKNILALSHGGLIRAALIKLGFATLDSLHHGGIENGAYAVIETDGIDFKLTKSEGMGLDAE